MYVYVKHLQIRLPVRPYLYCGRVSPPCRCPAPKVLIVVAREVFLDAREGCDGVAAGATDRSIWAADNCSL